MWHKQACRLIARPVTWLVCNCIFFFTFIKITQSVVAACMFALGTGIAFISNSSQYEFLVTSKHPFSRLLSRLELFHFLSVFVWFFSFLTGLDSIVIYRYEIFAV